MFACPAWPQHSGRAAEERRCSPPLSGQANYPKVMRYPLPVDLPKLPPPSFIKSPIRFATAVTLRSRMAVCQLVTRRLSTAVLAFLLMAPAVVGRAAQRPPNIIVILADDLGCGDISLYHGWVKTPRIDRMAQEGMTFTDFHSNSSVCSPTRAAFLTGRYQQRVGIVDVIVGKNEPDAGIPPATPTIARVFQKNGYATALFGKWHCGYENKFNPVHLGFNEFVG
ncbi:MAG: hypothetical protein EXS40_08500, partial [Opitutaceae bacterium]|nr:hypothetical protein [Opitutaceae bacterium]